MKTLEERFFEKTIRNESNDCLEWISYIFNSGYGGFWYDGRSFLAHRIAYMLAHGFDSLDDNILVLHRCDNKICVDYNHLFLGNHSDNTQDMISKGRQNTLNRVTGEDHPNSKLTEEDVKLMRYIYAQGGVTHRELAKEFGVWYSAVGRIIRRELWKHI